MQCAGKWVSEADAAAVFAIGDFEYEYVPFPSLSNHPRLIWDTQLYLRNSKVYLYYLYFAHVRFDTPKHTRCVQFLIIYLPIGAFFAELAGALMAPTHRLALYIGYGSTPIRLLAGLGAVPLRLAGAMDPRSVRACTPIHASPPTLLCPATSHLSQTRGTGSSRLPSGAQTRGGFVDALVRRA
jgi:hypothetical protein